LWTWNFVVLSPKKNCGHLDFVILRFVDCLCFQKVKCKLCDAE
jgi:hypothetical protein